MKKIFLFIALVSLTFTINSCSHQDDNNSKGVITFKVDGVQKTLNKIIVNEQKYLEGTANEYTQIVINASNKNSADWMIFSVKKGNLEDTIDDFIYATDLDTGHDRTDNFAFHIITNGEDRKITGTFSGDMTNGAGTISISEGSFNIEY